DLSRHPTMSLDLRRKQAGHPILREPRRLPRERARRGAGLLRTLRRGMAEEDNRTNQLIGELLGELGEQLELLPVVGRFEARAQTRRHCFPTKERSGDNVMSSPDGR